MLIEDYLQKYIGDSPVLYMLIGLAVLILVNLVLTLIIANKSKTDSIKFELLPDFITPLLLYGAFLIAGEAMILATKTVPYVYEAAKGFQVLAFLTVVLKYFKQVYSKLKQLGMETSPELDQKIDQIVPPTISPITGTERPSGTVITENFTRPQEDER